MASRVMLMTYLQHGFQPLPVINQGQSPQNTRNERYGHADITNVGHWVEFTLASIQQQFGSVLEAVSIMDEPVPPSPLRLVNSENAVCSRIDSYITNRVVRGLRASNDYLFDGCTVLHFDVGLIAQTPGGYTPDLAFFDPTLPLMTRPNRIPGDIKPLFKWLLGLQNHDNPRNRMEFTQVLSQINFYMKQNSTRYGFILTDCELVAIQRLNNNGDLELSVSIPWTAKGSTSQPKLTVLLALWYLGMLAANDQGWYLQ